ncbi:MAG: ISAzo13 family transposase [Bullifex sp.]
MAVASFETREAIRKVLKDVTPVLDEKQRRILFGSAAEALGHGGIAFVNEVTGSARNTIIAGMNDIGQEHGDRIRKEGGGRKSKLEKNPLLLETIEDIVRESTYGNPMNPLCWTTLSLRSIASILKEKYGYEVSQNIVASSLDLLGYSRQQNQKMEQLGSQHPDRDAQFRFINETSQEFLNGNDPVISVDTKKKELLGNFRNNGSEYRRVKDPRSVPDHDFELKELGRIVPCGVYVVNDNTGFVNLGTNNDISEFAGESILQWWFHVGASTFPDAKRIYITCDGGGSNSSRTWLWKQCLQRLADETGLEVHCSHLPPGTSKWNKIEHRLFCYISKNWEGKPLYDIETAVNLIGATTTKKGLRVKCIADSRFYEKGKKVTDEEKDMINIEFVGPNEKWNYIIKPSI